VSLPLAALSPEARILLLTAGPAANDAGIARHLAEPIDWGRMSALSDAERALAVVWARVAPLARGVPADMRERLARLSMVNEFRQAQLEAKLLEVLHRLEAMQARVLLLKGAALATTVYPSFSLRPMSDVDLLVEPGRAEEVHGALLGEGWKRRDFGLDGAEMARLDQFYRGHHHLWPLEAAHGPPVRAEIHTDILGDGHPFRFGATDLWSDARRIDYKGATALVPAPAHQLLHLCIHFAWSHLLRDGGWRAFRDLSAISARGAIDWPAFTALAQQSRAATCAYWTLRLAQALARVPVPPDVLDALRPSLPEAVLARLELHLAHEMIAPGALCPSVRLRRALWSAAIQPRRSGHGAARPWLHDGAFPVSGAARAEPRGIARWQAHLQRGSQWRRFLRTVVTLSPDAV
jgi:hypothetical protein